MRIAVAIMAALAIAGLGAQAAGPIAGLTSSVAEDKPKEKIKEVDKPGPPCANCA